MTARTRPRIRRHRPGDLGWIVAEHGRIYCREYGWDPTIEGYVAQVVGRFGLRHDPKREGCWIAEIGGQPVGALMLVRQAAPGTAQLRMFVVTPAARGRGVGRRLLAECLRFARRAGYRKVTLWTQKGLDAARHLYEEAGFKLVREARHESWGRVHIGQTWELAF